MNDTASLQHIDDVTKQIRVKIPAVKISEEVDSALQNLASRVPMKGFRAGKAPVGMVEKLHGERIRKESISRLIEGAINEVIQEHKFSVVGDPALEELSNEPGKDVEVVATFSIFPKPEVMGYESFEVHSPEASPSDEDVDRVIERIRRSRAAISPKANATKAAEGDVIEGEIQIAIDDAAPERSEPVTIKLGEGSLPKELEEGLVGISVGETKTIEGRIPDDHSDPALQGKKSSYTFTLKALHEQVLPELTDEFVCTLDGQERTVLELKMGVRQRLSDELNRVREEGIRADLISHLLEKNDFVVPKALIDDEIRNLAVRRGRVTKQIQKLSDVPVEEFRVEFEGEAINRVRASILIDRIAELENLHATKEDLDSHMKGVAAELGISEQEVRKFFRDEGRLVNLFVEQTRNKVLDMLRSRATVINKEKTSKESAPKGKPKAKK